MKKLFLILITVTLSYISSAQIQLRGKVISASKKQTSDTGSINIKTYYPVHTFFRLSDDLFVMDDMVNVYKYHLSDKEVSYDADSAVVISYVAQIGRDLRFVMAREINDCPDYVVIAVFSTDTDKFMEYIVKISKTKNKKAKKS